MRVILDVHTNSRIAGGVQYCSTPEGFESIREMHPDDEFIIKDNDAWNRYEDFTDFLEAMCWKTSDYFAMTRIEDDFAALEEELAMEALYDKIMAEEMAWYRHARQMGWE